MKNKFSTLQPVFYSLVLGLGLILGMQINNKKSGSSFSSNSDYDVIFDVLSYIQEYYVDTINSKQLSELTIQSILQNLDPHSYYIPKEELAEVNEPLIGNFEGIGIEFNIQRDTIMVISTISGGPSEEVGIRAGDRIVKIDGKNVAGVKISSQDVFKKLRGPKGTKVNVTVYRASSKKFLDFTIKRAKIPTHSIDASFMINDEWAYVKLSKFSATTVEEFKATSAQLLEAGMKGMILDLRGNGGGYLNAAVAICDEILPEGRLIVYTQGKSSPRVNYYSKSGGMLEMTRIIVLIDEWSASASEIVAGAMQDNERGILIGRRTFGKGLVQEQVMLPDSSAIRLTIARYYTPSGRCIQKSYKGKNEDYYNDFIERYTNGELLSADSIKIKDSVEYHTIFGRKVYGGGGITPDIFVPVDTSGYSNYLSKINDKNLLYQFAFAYMDGNREKLKATYKDIEQFRLHFNVSEKMLNDFVNFAEKNGVKNDPKGLANSKKIITTYLKAYIARGLFGSAALYRISTEIDLVFQNALDLAEKINILFMEWNKTLPNANSNNSNKGN